MYYEADGQQLYVIKNGLNELYLVALHALCFREIWEDVICLNQPQIKLVNNE